MFTLSLCYCVSTFFFFYCYGDHRDLHSFPTRRSSDLESLRSVAGLGVLWLFNDHGHRTLIWDTHTATARTRSEEHTSELQSHVNLVCRLLLEKKKNIHINMFSNTIL